MVVRCTGLVQVVCGRVSGLVWRRKVCGGGEKMVLHESGLCSDVVAGMRTRKKKTDLWWRGTSFAEEICNGGGMTELRSCGRSAVVA